MKLYVDPASSSSLRVLCYLRHKGLALDVQPISLRAGDHRAPAFAAINPSRAVPALDLGTEGVVAQSLAILEYLEALHPEPPALPAGALAQARVRALCGLVASDIHPVTNMRVRNAVAALAGDEAAKQWTREWTDAGLDAVDAWIARHGGRFAVGDALSFADFFVAPMAFNVRRFGGDLARHSRVAAVYDRCLALPAFEPLRGSPPASRPLRA